MAPKYCLPSANTHQQNEWLDDANQQRVQITVPHNPLAGQSLKVVRQTYQDNEPHLIVELPNGHTQLIPARWTKPVSNISHVSQTETILFSSTSLRALVRMVSHLKTQQQPEECNGCDTFDPTVDDFQSRDAPTDDLSVDRSAASSDSKPSVAPAKRRDR